MVNSGVAGPDWGRGFRVPTSQGLEVIRALSSEIPLHLGKACAGQRSLGPPTIFENKKKKKVKVNVK